MLDLVSLLRSPDPSNQDLAMMFLENGYWPEVLDAELLQLLQASNARLLRCLRMGKLEVTAGHKQLTINSLHKDFALELLSYLSQFQDLEALYLTGLQDLPTWNWSDLSNLKILQLIDCQFELGPLNLDLGPLQNLEELLLVRIPMLNFPSSEVYLPQLRRLTCMDCELEALHPSIYHLEGLEELNLSHNRLVHLPFQLGELSNLLRLQLNHNCLRSLHPSLSNLQKLRYLALTYNFDLGVEDKRKAEFWLPNCIIYA